jgi:hypothetical protein
MNDVWIIVSSSVSFHDLQAALSELGDAVSLSVGPLSTQLNIADKPFPSGNSAPDDWIEIEDSETTAELEANDPDHIPGMVPDPAFYALRYHGPERATEVLKAIASSPLAENPMLITDGEGFTLTGKEFLQRLESDPEWWRWRKR